MPLQKDQQRQVIASVSASLRFTPFFKSLKPDITPFIDATSSLSLTHLSEWQRLICRELSASLAASGRLQNWLTGSLGWLDLCHEDGFKRERALKILSGEAPNAFLLALLMRRLNDWVPQVRAAARESLPSVIQHTPPDRVADALSVTLAHWSAWGRMSDADRQTLLHSLADSRLAVALKQRLILATSGPVTRIFSQAGRSDGLDPFLTEIATLSRQPALRAKATRCLLENQCVWTEGMAWQWTDKVYGRGKFVPVFNTRAIAPREPFICGLKRAIGDPSPMVRRVAGEMLIKNLATLGGEAACLAEILACDTSESVAERGRYALADLARE